MTDASLTAPGARLRTFERVPWGRIWALSPWLSLALLAGWTRELSAWLLFAAAGLVLPALARIRGAPRSRALGLLVLLIATVSGFAAHRQLGRLSRDWDAFWLEREA